MSNATAITAYAAAELTNKALEEAGVDKRIPAQMIYNYTTARVRKDKKPLIPTVEVDGKVRVEVKGFTKWLQEYVQKNVPATQEA
jgi:hypothetical protein